MAEIPEMASLQSECKISTMQVSAFASDLLIKVRSTGANNTVVIGGLNFAYELDNVAKTPVVGFNIMYNTHPYDFGGKLVNKQFFHILKFSAR
jgi:hypothetical protein